MVNIEQFLKEYKYILERKESQANDYKFSYLIADYPYKKELFAKYFILDISDDAVYEHLSSMFSDQEVFSNFQRQLLETTFFNSNGDRRYNIYLIIIVKDNSDFLRNTLIQNDFKYARKIILSVSQVDPFFVDTIPLQRKREETYMINLVEKRKIINSLQESILKLRQIFWQEHFTRLYFNRKSMQTTIDNESTKDLMQLIFSFPVTDIKNNPQPQDRQKLNNNETSSTNSQAHKIEKIICILLKNYRRFKQNCEIPFVRVNLLFGENGTGKTSLLDAIEFGITGTNCKAKGKNWDDTQVEVKCRNSKSKIVSLDSQKSNIAFSDDWYNVKAETKEDFNLLFNRYNYFDTDWASVFAIGENEHTTSFSASSGEQVSLRMLQNFLGIDNIEEQKKDICFAYNKLIEYINENIESINKRAKETHWFRKRSFYGRYLMESSLSQSKQDLEKCKEAIDVIEKQMEMKSLSDTLSLHIRKIERIFMLLISTNEYSELRTEEDEIVAVRSGTNEAVPMSKMSTGQKVCLALAFMFELFLSNENTPNVIMLDEPVANLDDIHMLNLFDVLRRLALAGTQIFFTTANPDVAKLFRRKFSFLKDDFRLYEIKESDQAVKISYSEFLPSEEKPLKTIEIC